MKSLGIRVSKGLTYCGRKSEGREGKRRVGKGEAAARLAGGECWAGRVTGRMIDQQ